MAVLALPLRWLVNPARAGMIPRHAQYPVGLLSKPRASGDDPAAAPAIIAPAA